jgi:thiol-disulfide isomerase/thioredoxin
MKKILLGLMILTSMTVAAQKKTYEVSKDPKNGSVVFAGPVTFQDLDGESSFTWLKSGFESYKPRKKPLNYIRYKLKHYNMVVFLGTWCSDSHEIIPKLERIIGIIDYPQAQLSMYGVDRSKKTADAGEKKYNITLVPTIILFRDGREIGRVTERAHKNIEIDLANIIKSDPASAQWSEE